MASTLPIVDPCCIATCDDVVVQNIPGPAGADGAAGAAGTNGIDAYTLLTVAFTMPAEGAGATATVGSTAWIGTGQIVYIVGLGYLEATTILSGTTFTATNPENTASSLYVSNAAPGTISAIGSKVSPGGIQGPAGSVAGGTLVGDSTGTIGANELTIAATIGALPVGDGSKAQSLSKGTDGFILATDTAGFALDIGWKHSLPITGDAVLADNRAPRLDGAAGLPVPLQSSKLEINDQGAITAVGSGGNARGTDAIDLQVTRAVATQVASGNTSVIGGGINNTASGADSVIGGGDTNVASGTESFAGGGNGNTASGAQSTVAGGQTNVASGIQSTVGGGLSNTASNTYAIIAGGVGNIASATHSFVGGGDTNVASAQRAVSVGGLANTASGDFSSVLGGASNTAGSQYSSILGGHFGKTTVHGQLTSANNKFAAIGDAQASDLLWMIATTDATANVEMFLDGSSLRAVIPNNTSWTFQIQITVRTSAGLDAMYTSIGVIRNNATVVTASAIATTEVYDGATLPATPVTVDADAGNQALRIRVTGIIATNIRWVATARLVEVNY